MSYEIASPLSHLVLQKVQQERQRDLGLGDSTYRPLQIVSGYNPRLFVADPDMDSPAAGDSNVLDLTVGHYRAPRQR